MTLNPTIDKSCVVDQVLPEDKLRCRDVVRDPGGGGVNVCRVIHELGGSATAIYAAGGQTGNMLTDLLRNLDIRSVPLPIAAESRESLIVREESSGKQYRFGMPGPELSQTEWQQFLDYVRVTDPPIDYLVVSGSLPPGCESPRCSQRI